MASRDSFINTPTDDRGRSDRSPVNEERNSAHRAHHGPRTPQTPAIAPVIQEIRNEAAHQQLQQQWGNFYHQLNMTSGQTGVYSATPSSRSGQNGQGGSDAEVSAQSPYRNARNEPFHRTRARLYYPVHSGYVCDEPKGTTCGVPKRKKLRLRT